MLLHPSKQRHKNKSRVFEPEKNKSRVFRLKKVWGIGSILSLVALLWFLQNQQDGTKHAPNLRLTEHLPPLALTDGDPHIRALMRTISASESNGKNSYALLYGGSHVHDLSQHPNQCLPIKTGPNQDRCSTAAGRYQFLTSTWLEQAAKYHPAPLKANGHLHYSFEPKYQDIVVYHWLKDRHQWKVDILTLLREERIEEVLTQLSGVWTSLGGGIEDNSMTPHLPSLYRKFLAEELESTLKSPKS